MPFAGNHRWQRLLLFHQRTFINLRLVSKWENTPLIILASIKDDEINGVPVPKRSGEVDLHRIVLTEEGNLQSPGNLFDKYAPALFGIICAKPIMRNWPEKFQALLFKSP